MDLKIIEALPPWEWPDGAREMFLEALRDPQADDSDRLIAAELAGDYTVVDDKLAEALLSLGRNGDEPVQLRARAAISFGPALEVADEGTFEGDPEELISDDTFAKIKRVLQGLYMDTDVPKEVRRRVLEASVRAPQDWHQPAISSAYDNGDPEWNLTAVFCMRWVEGFDDQILEALESKDDEIHFEAVRAAGNWELDEAWPHILNLVRSQDTEKLLLLAAIEAVANVRPGEAGEVLFNLTRSSDEDIVEAAEEAIEMAQEQAAIERDVFGDDEDFDDDEDFGSDSDKDLR